MAENTPCPLVGKDMQIVVSIDGYSVTIHALFPSGGLWEARKRIEAALRSPVLTREEVEEPVDSAGTSGRGVVGCDELLDADIIALLREVEETSLRTKDYILATRTNAMLGRMERSSIPSDQRPGAEGSSNGK